MTKLPHNAEVKVLVDIHLFNSSDIVKKNPPKGGIGAEVRDKGQ